jgi:NADH-quinone oxidoreductase subunit K
VHSALCLVLCFFSSAAIWLLIEAEFLAIVLVLVYVGAVMVLFLFVVMMLDVNVEQLREGSRATPGSGWLVAAHRDRRDRRRRLVPPRGSGGIDATGGTRRCRRLQQHEGARRAPLHEYVYPFELAAVLLLVAIVAAIVLTMRKRPGSRCRTSVAVRARPRAPREDRDATRRRPPPVKGDRAGAAAPGRARRSGRRSRMITLQHMLLLSGILFAIVVAGIFLNRKNVILLLMCIELMLLAVNFNFVAFSRYLGDIDGQVFVFFILTVAAAESAIGLAILVVLFRERRSINVEDLDTLKG